MRKTILAIALALGTSGAMAANDSVHGGAVGGAQVSSSAFAATNGNGYASTETGGYQTSIHGFSGNSNSSYFKREGGVSVGGVAGAQGGAYSVTHTRGNGFAASGTEGNSYALTGGYGSFDTHGKNPEGEAAGFAVSKNSNEASTSSYGFGGAKKWNKSGTTSEFGASAWGNRDGYGTRRNPYVDQVETNAFAEAVGYKHGGGYEYGNGDKSGKAKTFGLAGAGASAEVGNTYSND